jgi:hypothetical protein
VHVMLREAEVARVESVLAAAPVAVD